MRKLFFLLGFLFAAVGGIGTFTSRQYMENHPELQIKTSLAGFFGQTEHLTQEAQMHVFFQDYGITVALIGAALLVLAFIWPKAKRR